MRGRSNGCPGESLCDIFSRGKEDSKGKAGWKKREREREKERRIAKDEEADTTSLFDIQMI